MESIVRAQSLIFALLVSSISSGAAASDAPSTSGGQFSVRMAFQGRGSTPADDDDALVSVVLVGDRQGDNHGPRTTSLEIHRRAARSVREDSVRTLRAVMTPTGELDSAQLLDSGSDEPRASRIKFVDGRLEVDGQFVDRDGAARPARIPVVFGVGPLVFIAMEFASGRIKSPALCVLDPDTHKISRASLQLSVDSATEEATVSVVEDGRKTAQVSLARHQRGSAGWVPRLIEFPTKSLTIVIDKDSVLSPLMDSPSTPSSPKELLVALFDAHLRGDARRLASLINESSVGMRISDRIGMSKEASIRQAVSQVQRVLPARAGSVEGGFEATAFSMWAASAASIRRIDDGSSEIDPHSGGVLITERRSNEWVVADVITPEECALDATRPVWSPKLAGVRVVMAALLGDAELLRAALDAKFAAEVEAGQPPRWVKVLQQMRLGRDLSNVERVGLAHKLLGSVTQDSPGDPSILTYMDSISVQVYRSDDEQWRVIRAEAR